MAATHADRKALAENTLFADRVTGAVLVYANTVGGEVTGSNVQKAEKRARLIAQTLSNPTTVGTQFARAAAGGTMANTYADTAGAPDVKLAAITDAAISTYVAAAWDIIAGVQPWERGA
jgi:hypothetical protein